MNPSLNKRQLALLLFASWSSSARGFTLPADPRSARAPPNTSFSLVPIGGSSSVVLLSKRPPSHMPSPDQSCAFFAGEPPREIGEPERSPRTSLVVNGSDSLGGVQPVPSRSTIVRSRPENMRSEFADARGPAGENATPKNLLCRTCPLFTASKFTVNRTNCTGDRY